MKSIQNNMKLRFLIVVTVLCLQNQSEAFFNITNLFASTLQHDQFDSLSDDAMQSLYEQELPLHSIVLNQSYSTKLKLMLIQKILDDNVVDINAEDDDGRTALNLLTFYKGDVAVAQLLLDNKADVNKPDRFNESPLHNTIRNELIAISKLLLQAQADITLKNDTLETPVDLARSPNTIALFGFA